MSTVQVERGSPPGAVARFGITRTVALVFAILWTGALVVAGVTVPVYSGESTSAGGGVSHDSSTLVGENGVGVLVVLCVPLVVTLLVAMALVARQVTVMRVIAWALTAVVGVLTVLGMLSIGIFIAPVTVALVVACAAEPRVGATTPLRNN